MFERVQHITADTMANTDVFYAPDACERVVALFRSFGGAGPVPPATEACRKTARSSTAMKERDDISYRCSK